MLLEGWQRLVITMSFQLVRVPFLIYICISNLIEMRWKYFFFLSYNLKFPIYVCWWDSYTLFQMWIFRVPHSLSALDKRFQIYTTSNTNTCCDVSMILTQQGLLLTYDSCFDIYKSISVAWSEWYTLNKLIKFLFFKATVTVCSFHITAAYKDVDLKALRI